MDEQKKAREEVNMTNCYEHCKHFFKRCKDGMIHDGVLISYWMMAGYIGPIDSVDEAYKRGHVLLADLIQHRILKPSDKDREMIQLVVASTGSIHLCRHERSCFTATPEFAEMLDVGRIERILLTDGMLKKRKGSADGNYLSRQVLNSERGLEYIAHFNPTPNSLKPLLENVDKPSVFMLQGCDDDNFFPMSDFTFEKFKTLTVLKMSGSGPAIPILKTIPRLTQLRYLCLSDPLIDSLPKNLFSELRELRWLILRGCSRLMFISNTAHLESLEVLDLSYTSTITIPNYLGEKLTHLFVRGSNLLDAPFAYLPLSLEVLDLSGNRDLRFTVLDPSSGLVEIEIEIDDADNFKLARVVDISENVPIIQELTNLEVLDFSCCENILELPEELNGLKNIKELNLSGCSRLENLSEDLFQQMSRLVKLDLSATKVKNLPSFANLTSLRKLSLRGLELDSLDYFETWTFLPNLVELDLHGLMISSSQELRLDFLQSLVNLRILNLSKTAVVKLPDMSKLGSLKELLLSDCQQLKVLPDLQPLTSLETLDLSLSDDTFASNRQLPCSFPSSLRKLVLTNRNNLEFLDLRGTDEIDLIGQGTISKSVQIHIVQATENQLSGFDRFVYEFASLSALVSDIQKNSDDNNQAFKSNCKILHADLKYIQQNVDRLQGSRHCTLIEELLLELMNAADNFSAADFAFDSPNLKQLFRVVKLLFLPQQAPTLEASNVMKKTKQSLFTKIVKKGNSHNVEYHPEEMDDLCNSYESLTNTQKNCLLCFSAFPFDEDDENLVIKKRILIY